MSKPRMLLLLALVVAAQGVTEWPNMRANLLTYGNTSIPKPVFSTGFYLADPTHMAYYAMVTLGSQRETLMLEVRFDLDDSVVLFRRQHEASLSYRPLLTGNTSRDADTLGSMLLRGTDIMYVNQQEVTVSVVSDVLRTTEDRLASEVQCDKCHGLLGLGPRSRLWDLWPDISFSASNIQGNRLHTLISEALASPFAQERVAAMQCDDNLRSLCETDGTVGLVRSSEASDSLSVQGHKGLLSSTMLLQTYMNFSHEEEEDTWREFYQNEPFFRPRQSPEDRFPSRSFRVRFSMHERYMRVPSDLLRALTDGRNVHDDDLREWDAIEVRIPVRALSAKTAARFTQLGMSRVFDDHWAQDLMAEGEDDDDSATSLGKRGEPALLRPAYQEEVVFRLRPEDYVAEIIAGQQRAFLIREFADSEASANNDTLEIGSFILQRFVMHKHAPYNVVLLLHYQTLEHVPTINLTFISVLLTVLVWWTLSSPREHTTPSGALYEMAVVPLCFFATIANSTIYARLRLYRYLLPFFFGFLVVCGVMHILSTSYDVWVKPARQKKRQRPAPHWTEHATSYAFVTRIFSFKMLVLSTLWMLLVDRRSDGIANSLTALIHVYIIMEMLRLCHMTLLYMLQELFPRQTIVEKWIARLLQGSGPQQSYAEFVRNNWDLLYMYSDDGEDDNVNAHAAEPARRGAHILNAAFHLQEHRDTMPDIGAHMNETEKPVWHHLDAELAAAEQLGVLAPQPPLTHPGSSPRASGNMLTDLIFMMFAVVGMPLLTIMHICISHKYFFHAILLAAVRDQQQVLDRVLVLAYLLLLVTIVSMNRILLAQNAAKKIDEMLKKKAAAAAAAEPKVITPAPVLASEATLSASASASSSETDTESHSD